MRERITRAKRLDNNEWVFGNLLYFTGNKEVAEDAYILKQTELVLDWNMRNLFRVDPETIGDWTGVTDKNGVKIFEGDIVRAANRDGSDGYIIGEVKFRTGYYVDFGGYSEFAMDEHEYEVIGNCADNLQLLKEK